MFRSRFHSLVRALNSPRNQLTRDICIAPHFVLGAHIYLTQDDAPTFLETFVEQTLEPGPPVSLKCAASGNPLPQITWSLDGYPVPDNTRFRTGDYVTPEGLLVSYVNITSVIAQGKIRDGLTYQGIARREVNKQLDVHSPLCLFVCSRFLHPQPHRILHSPFNTHSQCRLCVGGCLLQRKQTVESMYVYNLYLQRSCCLSR